MNVTFCGHAQVDDPDAAAAWLWAVNNALIAQGATHFYLGSYGEFDSIAASVLRNL